MFSLALLGLIAVASATVYFEEDFADGEAWRSRWVESTHKGDDAGSWKLTAGKFFGDAEADKGIQTAEDARFYQISAKFPSEASNVGSKLIVQYAVKHEQGIDCGGGYLKLMPAGLDQTDLNGDSEYNIMFGPDICGATKRVHVIYNYKGKNHLLNKEIPCPSDEDAHMYALITNPDGTYEVKIDGESKQSGSLEDDWDMLPPKEIDDPADEKPADWVDEEYMDDPEDVKPDGYDDIPAQIADPDAVQPDDWDAELDGDWEAPLIDNPEFKGPWSAKQIKSPAYKGVWAPKRIANPDYAPDATLGQYKSHAFVALENWQVKSGTIFDRFLVTDDEAKAQAAVAAFLADKKVGDQKRADHLEAERKKMEEEAAAAADAAADDEEEEDADDEAADEEAADSDLRDEL